MRLQKKDLIDFFVHGIKQTENRGIGIEKECFLYDGTTHGRLDYPDIRTLIQGFVEKGWTGVFEGEYLIGATKDNASISLEPGGQFELSGKVHPSLVDAKTEVDAFDNTLQELLDQKNFKSICIGFEPFWKQDDLSWMPKGRYEIMRTYMPKVGGDGLDMMRRTSTLQVNLDYTSEENMVQMMRLTQLLHPLLAALFAASPFYEGEPSGYQSFRNFVWQDTDKDRCGLLDFVFQDDFGFERYVEYLLDVPMYFVYRKGYIDASGLSFRDFMGGSLKACPGEFPTMDDFKDQMSIAFPEVRLKTFIEIRGIDASPVAFAAAAFWVGLLYHQPSLEKSLALAEPLLKTLKEDYVSLPKEGLTKESQWELAESLCDIAERGLESRKKGEGVYLEALKRIVQTRTTYAQKLLSDMSIHKDVHKILL